MARPEDDILPRPFGSYQLLRRLAIGGMAEVYVAAAKGVSGFEKLVAIKVIHHRYSEDEQFIRMLVDEAKLSVLLQHANIAQTFDLGCYDGRYFIVMEYVEGADASRLLRRMNDARKRLPIEACLFIAAEVCAGLDYAHRKCDPDGRKLNVIHRDVSPQNVLLSMAGEVKLADFGIAKAALRSSETEVGVIKGKYYYMSPEQAWADPMDHRSDIFSTGVVLYELLTGEMLYALEDNLPAILDKVRRAKIEPPSKHRAEIPAELDAVILKALSRHPEDRYASAYDFGQALLRVLYSLDPAWGGSRLARVMDTYFGPDARPLPSGGFRHDSEKPTAFEVLPKMESRELLHQASIIFPISTASQPPADADRTRSESVPLPERAAARPPMRGTGIVEQASVSPQDPRASTRGSDDDDEDEDEDEATTFYSREQMAADPLTFEIDVPPSDDATVVDSSGEMGRKLDELLSLGGARPPRHDDEPDLRARAARATNWEPPAPTWPPLPFVGPPLEAGDQAPTTVRPGKAKANAKAALRGPTWPMLAVLVCLAIGIGLAIAVVR